MKDLGQPTMEVVRDEPSLLDAILSSIYILDYSTLYSALSREIDPSPTPAIDILKSLRQ
jgi:hypothetical protein